MNNKSEFIRSLDKEAFEKGLIKFNIPDKDKIDSLNGEGVWGWVTQEDKEKHDDNTYKGKITAILVNHPLNYYGILRWGDEVVLQCHGDSRPTLAPDWVKKIYKEANNG